MKSWNWGNKKKSSKEIVHIFYAILKAPWYTDNSRVPEDSSYSNIERAFLIGYNEGGKKCMGK